MSDRRLPTSDRIVEPDENPYKRCTKGHEYNPFKHGACPYCEE